MSIRPEHGEHLNKRQKDVLDLACDRFESAFRNNEKPAIETYLADMEVELRGPLFLELLGIEVELIRKQGKIPDQEGYRCRFPNFHAEIDDIFDAEQDLTNWLGKRGSSKGLHIRCPHCSNRVQLLADTPYEDVTCRTCGSTFNLAYRDEHTIAASTFEKVGHFELVSRLGVGAFGTVWKARDTELDCIRAVKIPRKGQLDEKEIKLFFNEAQAAARLRHPNIVSVHEVGRESDTLFIVCDLIRGITLSDWMTGERPDTQEVVRVCTTIANALDHAHKQGVIHRDLKPSNIMLDRQGEPHLMDFGLAKRDAHEITMTVEGEVLGTPAYMSPEQAEGRGHWSDRRTDIYSLGVILFELLTGELPFRGNAQLQVQKRLTEDAPDPRSLNRHIPRDLSTICLKCLERNPAHRYGSARKLADEFRRYQEGFPIQARPITRISRVWRWSKRNPTASLCALLTIILAIGGPLAAIHFGKLNRENQNLILDMEQQRQSAVAELSEAEKELEKWNGKADPWQLWPEHDDDSSWDKLLRMAYERHYPSEVKRLEGLEEISLRDAAAAQLGLAILADRASDQERAVLHYDQARISLQKLLSQSPNDNNAQEVLADCHLQLSRLYGTEEKKLALQSLAAASELYQRLESTASNPEVAVKRVDTDLRRALFAGFDHGLTELSVAQELSDKVMEDWPSDPAAFYRLTATLARKTAILDTVEVSKD